MGKANWTEDERRAVERAVDAVSAEVCPDCSGRLYGSQAVCLWVKEGRAVIETQCVTEGQPAFFVVRDPAQTVDDQVWLPRIAGRIECGLCGRRIGEAGLEIEMYEPDPEWAEIEGDTRAGHMTLRAVCCSPEDYEEYTIVTISAPLGMPAPAPVPPVLRTGPRRPWFSGGLRKMRTGGGAR